MSERKRRGRNGIVINFLIKIFMGLNKLVIRASRGYLGTLLLSQNVLLLYSQGRKTGRERITPISYFKTDGCYFLVGSNWARRHNAAWYYNLLAHPRTVIEVKGRTIPVEASEVTGEDYDRLWKIAVRRYPAYERYKRKAGRHIPIVLLKPVE